ncbi:hypothetical protein QFC22_006035 [Naganishia vaughanmartiniae]|uniref:Uncharacterized protein n=1 Tax=Naganishia vaughanmartiniae TaxID=1424756 RepID=A0ACC2WP13_9TREE|nr:hypothetical protein QFC22_006035 [Naganishia vaughanmartiniae]
MTASAVCRNAWISTGFKLRPVTTQSHALAQPRHLRGRTSARGTSSSHSPRAEADDSDIKNSPSTTETQPPVETSSIEASTHTPLPSYTTATNSKSSTPVSLKDIFPDLFGELKPTTSQPITRAQRNDWQNSLDDSIRDPQSKIDTVGRRSVRSATATSSSTLGIGSKLSSILDMGSSPARSNRNRISPPVYGTKDRTRAAPKELQAFHELLESMFEASEARGGQAERKHKRDGRGDSYLSDSMLGRPRLNRRNRDDTTQGEYQERHRLTTIAKPIGGMKNITDAEWDEFMQQKEVIASLRTDLDILEWLKTTYFSMPLPTTSSDASNADETATTFGSIYPLVLAHTISILHVQFRNPQAAVAVFNTARSHSLESYLVGCTTSVYNHMLRARWEGLGDLKGVEEGLEEMGRRGVGWDKETMRLANTLVENLVKLRLSSPYGNSSTHVSNDQRLVWAYGPDVFARLARLEEIVESQVEFVERKGLSAVRRRADEVADKEMSGVDGYAQGAHAYAPRGQTRSWSESLRPNGHH